MSKTPNAYNQRWARRSVGRKKVHTSRRYPVNAWLRKELGYVNPDEKLYPSMMMYSVIFRHDRFITIPLLKGRKA